MNYVNLVLYMPLISQKMARHFYFYNVRLVPKMSREGLSGEGPKDFAYSAVVAYGCTAAYRHPWAGLNNIVVSYNILRFFLVGR